MVKELGIKGLYKGSTITLLRDVPYSMIFFPLNANLKTLFSKNEDDVSLLGLMASGMIAGAFASGLSTPFSPRSTPSDPHGRHQDARPGREGLHVGRQIRQDVPPGLQRGGIQRPLQGRRPSYVRPGTSPARASSHRLPSSPSR